MEREHLEECVALGLSQRGIAKKFGISQAAVRYWLDKFALQTAGRVAISNGLCKLCGNQLKTIRRTRCGSCNTKIRRLRNKLAAIAYLGGKCTDCGWRGHPAGYDFHHLAKKSFEIGCVSNKSWRVIKQELAKCILLCRRCHAIRHVDYDNPLLLAEMIAYRGVNPDLIIDPAISLW